MYCKTAGNASSFGGSGGEADDRGQNGSYCKTAHIAFFFGSMKNILFPFSGENSFVETGVVARRQASLPPSGVNSSVETEVVARRQASLPPSGEVAAKPTIGDKAEVTAKRQTSLFSSEV